MLQDLIHFLDDSLTRRHNRVFHSEEHTTSYYGGEGFRSNGLYVVPNTIADTCTNNITVTSNGMSRDNYGYIPPNPAAPGNPPRPPLPRGFSPANLSPPSSASNVYPETAGHLV